MMWTVYEAVQLLEILKTGLTAAGYCGAIGGSLSYRGVSDHDMDLVVFPRGDRPANYEELISQLAYDGLVRVRTKEEVQAGWRQKGSKDTKHVEEWNYKGKRVDLIILNK